MSEKILKKTCIRCGNKNVLLSSNKQYWTCYECLFGWVIFQDGRVGFWPDFGSEFVWYYVPEGTLPVVSELWDKETEL